MTIIVLVIVRLLLPQRGKDLTEALILSGLFIFSWTGPLTFMGLRSFYRALRRVRITVTPDRLAIREQCGPIVRRCAFDADRLAGLDAVLLALPSGAAARAAAVLVGRVASVVDLSGDLRLGDAETYAQWYGRPHPAPHLLGEAVVLDRVDRDGQHLVRLGVQQPALELLVEGDVHHVAAVA